MSRLRLMQKNSETWPEAREMLAKARREPAFKSLRTVLPMADARRY